jgi:hypothetical protein
MTNETNETNETTPEAYILPAAVRDAILTYLGNRPYREVASGFQALLDLCPQPALSRRLPSVSEVDDAALPPADAGPIDQQADDATGAGR